MNEYPQQEHIERLKEDATTLRVEEQYDRALMRLDRAIKRLDELFPRPKELDTPLTSEERAICADRADCYGMRGGVFRRITTIDNPLEKALESYERGIQDERFGNQSTYCRTNAIILPILLGYQKSSSPSIRDRLSEVLPFLEKAVEDSSAEVVPFLEKGVEDHLAQRRWAWADLGQFYLLAGRLEDALRCYDEYKDAGASERDLDTTLDILEKLSDALGNESKAIQRVIVRLKS